MREITNSWERREERRIGRNGIKSYEEKRAEEEGNNVETW